MRLASLLTTFALLSAATDSYAQYDLSGRWFVTNTKTITGLPYESERAHWDVVQNAGMLNVTITDEDGNVTGPASGTIDEGTGTFQFESVQGTVTADSLVFTAARTYQTCSIHTCLTVDVDYDGTRCGNGVVNAGEECDDDNADAGDCCLPSCISDKRGTACASDDNVCTDDVCDGDGTCEHDGNTAACVGGPSGCSMGTCSSGDCVLTSLRAAGSSCDIDADHCTADTCDGAGTCTAGGPLDCAPCGVCDSDIGCIAEFESWACEDEETRVSLKISAGPAPRQKIALDYETGHYSGPGRGDPTDDTSYTFCVYRQVDEESPKVVLFAATVPPGGVCGEDPCWQDDHGGFRYRNKDRSPNGIESIKSGFNPTFAMRGRKELLGLPTELPATPATFFARIITNDGASSSCWMNGLQTERISTKKYKGSH